MEVVEVVEAVEVSPIQQFNEAIQQIWMCLPSAIKMLIMMVVLITVFVGLMKMISR